MNFACYISKDNRQKTDLDINKFENLTMSLKMKDSSKFDFANMNVIHFGDSEKTINLC